MDMNNESERSRGPKLMWEGGGGSRMCPRSFRFRFRCIIKPILVKINVNIINHLC